MMDNIKAYLVDDDLDVLEVVTNILKIRGISVTSSSSSKKALEEIKELKPDITIMDLMMPELDGLELCKLLRQEPSLDDMKIVFISGKSYEFDIERAYSFGADGYIIKPIPDAKKFLDKLEDIIDEKIEIGFWGVRGTLPVPGDSSIRYGGNTCCVSIQFPRENLFIFDAGSGIKAFSNHLLANSHTRLKAKIFISHPHWDHINALPFFVPLFIPGNEFEICGPSHGNISMRELISAQMEGVYFPIRIKEFAARVYFRDLKEQDLKVDQVNISTLLLSHPGYSLGYRMDYKGKIICYITDNELYPEGDQYYNANYREKLTDFIKSADILITDTTYTADEYKSKRGWGHSSVEEVVKIAHQAQVKKLFLYHHDPDQTDNDIDVKLDIATNILDELGSTTVCLAPSEQEHFKL